MALSQEVRARLEPDAAQIIARYPHPVGDYHVGVCTNSLCAVMGGDAILADLHEHLGVGDDEPTPDGKVSVEHLECNAACDYAPVVMVNWEFFDNMTPQSARDLVDGLRSGATGITPTRGAPRLCTWKQASRILAGFPDDQAAGGNTAGEPSLAGLKVAREQGWTPGDDAAGSGPSGSGVPPAGAAAPRSTTGNGKATT